MTAQRFPSARRFYLAKRYAAAAVGDEELALVWQAKQEAEPATELPSEFPARSSFVAAGYSGVEDFDGADEDELMMNAGVSRRSANAAITAVEDI